MQSLALRFNDIVVLVIFSLGCQFLSESRLIRRLWELRNSLHAMCFLSMLVGRVRECCDASAAAQKRDYN